MTVTKNDIQSFHQFADDKLANGGVGSLHKLVTEWEERQEVNAAIREGIADVEAGRTEPFFESQNRFREERNLPPRT